MWHFTYIAKNRSAEYKKTAGINLCAVINEKKKQKYLVKKRKTNIYNKKSEMN